MQRSEANLDIWEIRAQNAIHNSPYMRNWIFVVYLDAQLLAYKAPCAFTAKQILRSHTFLLFRVDMLKVDLDRVGGISPLILEPNDCPGPLNIRPIGIEVPNEDSLDQSLV